MTYNPFYISSFENDSGLDTYLEPFLIPEKAFPELEDAYAWRGRIKRRQGYSSLGRLRRVITAYNFFHSSASPWSFNLKVVKGGISAANNANPGQITTPYAHGLSNGDLVVITGIVGATGYNNVTFTITVVDAVNFTVGVDASGFGVYASGGTWISNRSLAATEPNAEIKPGSVIITLAGPIVFTDQGNGTLTSVTPGNSGTINYLSGAVVLTHTAGAGVAAVVTFSYFPALPCMGLRAREIITINDEQTIAFDTKYAYRHVGTEWQELPSAPLNAWFGTNSDFFWTTNYYQNSNGDLFWATNFNKSSTPDPIYYYDSVSWTAFAPTTNGANELHQCRCMIPYKDRLVVANTWEGASLAAATNFPQRLRWSQNGDPTDQTNGWRDDIVGRGGYLDISTNEQFISFEFVKDTLLAKFERSSWKIVYTGNEVLPFVAQKINTELGSESTFSLIPFDRGVFSVGNFGITADDSVNVIRIDQRIPQTVFNINNDNQGVKRVYGIRDYTQELVYWSYPNSAQNPVYPNRVLVYNYVNNTFAIFKDNFTCYGYFQSAGDYTWADLPYENWASWDEAWDSGTEQSLYPDVAAGNQQGFIMLLNQTQFNAKSLAITAITPGSPVVLTIPAHNLETDQYIKITDIIGSGSPNPNTLNDFIYKVLVVDANNITLLKYNASSPTFFDQINLTAGGTYLGGGSVTRVNNISIKTKRFSPFYDQGDQVRVGYIDFFVDKTSDGEMSVNCFIDENSSIPINDPHNAGNAGLLGDNIIYTKPNILIPFQQGQEKIWQRLYLSAICQNFQLQFFLDPAQMSDEDINSSLFNLHAMTLYLSPNARMIQ